VVNIAVLRGTADTSSVQKRTARLDQGDAELPRRVSTWAGTKACVGPFDWGSMYVLTL
jgi:hypothetical protein